jgi:hypothetical protein
MQPHGMSAIIATKMIHSAILIHIARLHRQAAAALRLRNNSRAFGLRC